MQDVAKFAIPPEHAPWLPPALVVESYLRDGRPTPGTVQRLTDTAYLLA